MGPATYHYYCWKPPHAFSAIIKHAFRHMQNRDVKFAREIANPGGLEVWFRCNLKALLFTMEVLCVHCSWTKSISQECHQHRDGQQLTQCMACCDLKQTMMHEDETLLKSMNSMKSPELANTSSPTSVHALFCNLL